MTWVYEIETRVSGEAAFCVGTYVTIDEGSLWIPDCICSTAEEAARRVNYLNGGTGMPYPIGGEP